MANLPISGFPAAAALGGTELVAGVQAGANVKITINQVKTYILSGVALLTANTFTATQTITPAANTSALVISGASLTGTDATSFASIAGTWNTSGTPTALAVNITDTASNASSRLAAFRVGGADRVVLLKSGRVVVAQAYQVATPQYTHTTDLTSGMSVSTNGVFFHAVGTSSATFSTDGLTVSGTLKFGWAPAGADSAAPDTMMTRKAAAIIHHGAQDAASPVAQTLGTQGSRSGTDSNVAGANLTVRSGIGTGNSTGSSLIFQTPTAVASGTGAQTSTTRLTLSEAGGVVVASGVALQLGNAAVTGLVAGTLAATTNASIVITDSAGQAYRIPCII